MMKKRLFWTCAGLVLLIGGFLAGLGCAQKGASWSSSARYAVGTEQGQRSISREHAKMWSKSFTEKQWLVLLHQREHQPRALWHGVRTGSVKHNSHSITFSGLTFSDSRSNVLEHQLSFENLMEKHPLMFLSLFDDQDTEVVLTGVCAYRRKLPESSTQVQQIADAFGKKLLGHRDVRVRWAAMQTLGENRWLTPNDIRRGLNDETDTIRVTTAFWIHVFTRERNAKFLYDDNASLVSGDPQQLEEMVGDFIELAPVLLDHINDTHFFVRDRVARDFRLLFRHWLDRGGGSRSHVDFPDLPAKTDWIRTDWRTRRDTHEAWKQWWIEHGQEALRRAHPGATQEVGKETGDVFAN